MPRKTIRQAVLSLARRTKRGRRARSDRLSPPVQMAEEEEEEGGREKGKTLLLPKVKSDAVGGPWRTRVHVADRWEEAEDEVAATMAAMEEAREGGTEAAAGEEMMRVRRAWLIPKAASIPLG